MGEKEKEFKDLSYKELRIKAKALGFVGKDTKPKKATLIEFLENKQEQVEKPARDTPSTLTSPKRFAAVAEQEKADAESAEEKAKEAAAVTSVVNFLKEEKGADPDQTELDLLNAEIDDLQAKIGELKKTKKTAFAKIERAVDNNARGLSKALRRKTSARKILKYQIEGRGKKVKGRMVIV